MMRTKNHILLAILIAITTAACVSAVKDSRAEGNWCTFVCEPIPTIAPTPTPTPATTPTPSPTPTPTPDAIVAPSGGDFTTIAAAYSAASCGDHIWVRDGTYNTTSVINLNKSCSSGNEITVQNYPGESPKVVCTDPTAGGGNDRVEINGPYNVWDGIEVSSCYDGIKNYASHTKILNSKIHNNIFTGIVNVPLSGTMTDVEIAGNTLELSGYIESGSCTVGVATSCTRHDNPFDPGNPISVKNVHQIYISNTTCNNVDGVHIHGNTIRNYGGRAFQMNGTEGGDGAPCQADGIKNVVFEDNNVSGGSWGISAYYGISEIEVTGNTFTLDSWPATNDSDHTFFGIWGLTDSEISGNTLSSSSSSMRAFYFYDDDSGCPENLIGGSSWDLSTDDWMWSGGVRSDFSSAFGSVSGCGG